MDEHKTAMAGITIICTLGALSSISPAINTVITGIVITVLVIGVLVGIGYLMQINCQHPTDKNKTIPGYQVWWNTLDAPPSAPAQREEVKQR